MKYILIVGRRGPTRRHMQSKLWPLTSKRNWNRWTYTWVDMKPRPWQKHPMPVAIHQPARYEGPSLRDGLREIGKSIQRGIDGMIRLMQKGWAGVSKET